jgi:hypothetical protein
MATVRRQRQNKSEERSNDNRDNSRTLLLNDNENGL